MRVVIPFAPVMMCDTQDFFLDIGKKKFLEDIETQGICVADVPDRDEWEKELARKPKYQRYHKPTDEEYKIAKDAKIVNQVYQYNSPSEQRRIDTEQAALKAKEKFEGGSKKSKKGKKSEELEPETLEATE